MVTGFFFVVRRDVFPCVFPYKPFLRRSAGPQLVQKAVDFLCPLPAHLFGHMAVGIQGKCRGIMAQVFLHCLDITAGLQGQHSVGMPQIMKAKVRNTHGRKNPLEIPVNYIVLEVFPQLIGKYKSIWIAPCFTQGQLHFVLQSPLTPERLNRPVRQHDASGLVAFRGSILITPMGVAKILELPLYFKCLPLEINILSLEAQQLALPHTREEIQQIQILVPMALNGFEKLCHLGAIQNVDLRPGAFGQYS